MSVKLTTRTTNGVVIVQTSGRVTLGEGSSTLRKGVRELVEGGTRQILLDLAEVDYMDSSGLGELLASHRTTLAAGGDLKLLHVSARIREPLEMMGLHTVFEIFDDEDSAVESFSSGIVDEDMFEN